jgi:radical SAM family uncharacterized protein/radical SAM-linked protein
MNPALFQKPSRYIGNEVNIIRKEAGIKVALCFPDTYEIGMSHLGLKILYSIINNIPDASAERVFAPWVDLEEYLRKEGLPLTSLEFNRPLKDFDMVGFTLQYELSYTNILNMLDLGGIPVRSEERNEDHPLVIAGGPCAVNPLPLAPFIDAFVIGDGEEAIIEIIKAYSTAPDRTARLKELSTIEGVYVPALHDTGIDRIRKRVIEDLDKAPFPDAPIVPYTSVVHDRVAIEVARGCTKGCRFCQAGMIYRPLRERSMENVLALSQTSLEKTGHEEISFTSLSTGEYSCLLPLIRSINKACSGSHIAVSLPSLRVGSINKDVLKEIRSVRKTGFTMAPEAGTSRMRNIINKDFTEEEYDETLEMLFSEGWKSIKLYFMIGLPSETRTDIDGIINMAKRASAVGKKITKRRVNINVGISAFVPKPHTPFQWLGQDSYDGLREKQEILRNAFGKRGINFKGQHVELSLLEAVFSRGGRESSLLLENAWRLGCRFDGWGEMFDFEKWLGAAERSDIDLYAYSTRRFELDEELPWGFIDTGLTDDFLRSEFHKALEGAVTPDCRDNCIGCGLKCKSRTQSTEHGTQNSEHRAQSTELRATSANAKNLPPAKIRVRFSKTGSLRFLSHHELMTVILRATRRAKMPVSYSEGFHPHPKVSFGPALSAGVEGMSEYFDIEISTLMRPEEFIQLINPELPDGLIVLDAGMISKKTRSLNDFVSRYKYEIIIDKEDEKYIHSFMNLDTVSVSRKKKDVDIRPMVEAAEVKDKKLYLTLKDNGIIKVRLFEILKELINKPVDELYSLSIRRTGLYGLEDNRWVEPLKAQ